MRRTTSWLLAEAGVAALLPVPCPVCMGREHDTWREPVAEAPNIVVFGRGEAQVGVGGAASEGRVAGSDLLVRSLLRVAELLEAVPRLVAALHSGSGKADQSSRVA